MLRLLMYLSEGKTLSRAIMPITRAQWAEFTAAKAVGYVVVDHARATPALQALIDSTLQLSEIGHDASFHLYRP